MDGLFCATDRIAIGAVKAIQERGLTAGSDIKVLGVGNDELGSVSSPSISTFNYPFDKAGESAAKLLIDLLSGEPASMSKIVLTFQTIDRETC